MSESKLWWQEHSRCGHTDTSLKVRQLTGSGDAWEKCVAVKVAVDERAVDLLALGELEGLLIDLAAADDKALGDVVSARRRLESRIELKRQAVGE